MDLDLSIIIIAKDEESNIKSCLSSLPKGAEIILVDSGSNDRTVAIAKEFTDLVFENPFINHGEQKNFALSKATKSWIFSIDADETLNPKLCQWLLDFAKDEKIKNNLAIDAYRTKRQLVFQNKPLRFGKAIDYPIRLFRRGSCSFVGSVHEKLDVTQSKISNIKQGIIYHYSYASLKDYFDRFNRYTSKVAERHFDEQKMRPSILKVTLRFPFEFLSRYVIRLGFLDGYPGYIYALISSMYATIKYAKLKELYEGSVQLK